MRHVNLRVPRSLAHDTGVGGSGRKVGLSRLLLTAASKIGFVLIMFSLVNILACGTNVFI